MLARVLFALFTGVLLRFVVNLHPVYWLAWLVLTLLLWAVLESDARGWRWLTLLSCLIGYQVNAVYYFRVMPIWAAILVVLAQSWLLLFILAETRRIVLRSCRAWTIIVFPVFWVAADTLMAHLLPDGNFASLAYTQSDFLPLMQTASLFGVPGVLFLLCLVPSAIAITLVLGMDAQRARSIPRPSCARFLEGSDSRIMLALTTALFAAAIIFGTLRLREPDKEGMMRVGMAAVDDPIGPQATARSIELIQFAYDEHVAALADQGARLVVLPEKIAVVRESDAPAWKTRFAAMASQYRVWLLAGIAVQTPKGILNNAWLFSPQGTLDANYEKHVLAPPERAGYLVGTEYVLRTVESCHVGIAICKDMHFATLGRANGQRGAAIMLVPAWDFWLDRWMASRMTAARGIENGYAIVRSAREGMLSVSDPYGRIVAERASSPLPGQHLLVNLPVAPRRPTLYTEIGDAFGWLCVALAAGFMGFGPLLKFAREKFPRWTTIHPRLSQMEMTLNIGVEATKPEAAVNVFTYIGTPSNKIGNDGDFYLEEETNMLYGPKSNGAWPEDGVPVSGPVMRRKARQRQRAWSSDIPKRSFTVSLLFLSLRNAWRRLTRGN